MRRIFGIELRRSAALGIALVLAVLGTLLLLFFEGIWFRDGWVQLAMTQRLYLVILWPLALAAGAWQARREHRSQIAELFTSTPRPRVQRVVPTLGAMAAAMVAGYLAVGLAGAAWIGGTARYFPATVLIIGVVGAVSLIAAAWLGLAAGRLLPSPITAPALGVGGLALLLLLPAMTRPLGWLALIFSPTYQMNMPDTFATVPSRVSAAQLLWLVALAAAAVLLLVSNGRRLRLAALLPVALGAALAIAVMPHDTRIVYDAVDPVAQELVCAEGEPQVCVSRVHAGRLSEVTPPAREALAALAKLPGMPSKVHEDTTTYLPETFPERRDDVALVGIEPESNGHVDLRTLDVVAAAFASPPACEDRADPADGLAAAAWLLGQEPTLVKPDESPYFANAVATWQALRELPGDEVRTRITALRASALACSHSGLLPPGTR